jgi:thiosulfate/3-mercaptopyruvate sulfurtransferase
MQCRSARLLRVPGVGRFFSAQPSPSSLVVSTEWLHDQLRAGAPLAILDASWYMPAAQRQPQQEWALKRIPTSRFFDIDLVSRRDTTLPHMLPTAADFSIAASELGVSHSRPVIVYDSAGLFSAARALFTLRCFGHARSYVLSGGLPKWLAEGRPVETAALARTPLPLPREDWALDASEIRTLEQVQQVAAAYTQAGRVNSSAGGGGELLVDARSAGRFTGVDPEPRPGLPSGHAPGSCSVPFDTLLAPVSGGGGGELLDRAALRRVFEAAGVDVDRPGPIVVSCGSGITACILWLALRQAGRSGPVALFDGSWVEYAASPASVVAKGGSGRGTGNGR